MTSRFGRFGPGGWPGGGGVGVASDGGVGNGVTMGLGNDLFLMSLAFKVTLTPLLPKGMEGETSKDTITISDTQTDFDAERENSRVWNFMV